MTDRRIVARLPATRVDNAGLVTRIPAPRLSGPSPFLVITHHGPQIFPPNNTGFPFGPHPHRGFETVTFIRSGQLLHEDSRSPPRLVRSGGVQWMTAGLGVVHNESAPPEFMRNGGLMEMLQLWLNLPSKLKNALPNYVGLEAEDIPTLLSDDELVAHHLVAGQLEGQRGPIQSLTDVTMLVLDLQAGGRTALPAQPGRDVFLYVVEGAIDIAGEIVEPFTRVEFDRTGDCVSISASRDATVIFGCADLIEEPVAARGPFVMTTQDELVQAARDYQAGRFA